MDCWAAAAHPGIRRCRWLGRPWLQALAAGAIDPRPRRIFVHGLRFPRAATSLLLNGTGFGSGMIPVPLHGLHVGCGSIFLAGTMDRISVTYLNPKHSGHFMLTSRISRDWLSGRVSCLNGPATHRRSGAGRGPHRTRFQSPTEAPTAALLVQAQSPRCATANQDFSERSSVNVLACAMATQSSRPLTPLVTRLGAA
jgi:hypothetical protein